MTSAKVTTRLAFVAIMLLSAGCSQSPSPALPLAGSDGTAASPLVVPSSGRDLEAVAGVFYDCLQGQGLPAEYAPGPDGRSTMVQFNDGTPAYWVTPAGEVEWTSSLTEPERQQAISDYQARYHSSGSGPGGRPNEVFLFVSGTDRTDAWKECIGQSGFDDAAVAESSAATSLDAAWQRKVIDASNDWAKCARSHGINGIIDAHEPADESDPVAVMLPWTTTEDQLAKVLDSCPISDPGADQSNDRVLRQALDKGDPYLSVIDQMKAEPAVIVEPPGPDAGQSDWDNLDKLMKMITQAEAGSSGG
jgi:hypothetical protein